MVTVRISERSIDKLKTAAIWAVLLFLMLALGTVVKAQQTIAPFYTSQENTNVYVKMGSGSLYPTIAKATTKACTAPSSFTVVLLPGANPADSIGGQTGVCNGVVLIDYTAAPAVTYKGNGTIYVSQGGGGGCSGPCVTSFDGRTGAVTLTAPDLATAVAGQTGCTTAGFAWNPATNTCTPSGTVTASAMQSALSAQTGCTTSGNVWDPATNTCVPAGSTTAAGMQAALVAQTGCTTAGFAWNPATNTCTASGSVTAGAMQTAMAGQSGCTTAGLAWNPATNTCVTATSVQSIPYSSTTPISAQAYLYDGSVMRPTTLTPAIVGAEPAGAIVPGALADYTFTEGSGTTLFDQTANHNDGTLGAGAGIPTWLGTGLQFTQGAGVQLPSALNAAQTFFVATYIDPFQASTIASPYSAVLTSTVPGNAGLNLFIAALTPGGSVITGAFAPSIFSAGVRSSCLNILSGFHVFAYQVFTAAQTKIWIDGIECNNYAFRTYDGTLQSSGQFYLGSTGSGLWSANGLQGAIFRAIFYPTALADVQVQAMSGIIKNQIEQRGVNTAPVNVLSSTPQFHAIGDSITAGTTASYAWPTALTLVRQPPYQINNWGVPSALLTAEDGSEPNRVGVRCVSSEGPNLAIVFSGTNDFLQGYTPAQVVSNYAGEVQTLEQAGCRVFVATMLSRFYGGVNYDPTKNAFDELLLSQAKAMGADGVVDFAADPNLGADGAYANATWFTDQTHPTNAGQSRLGQIASNALNYYFGYTLSNPNVVTLATYTLASEDAAVTAAPASNAAYTMPDCTGPSGGTYIISNPQSAFTVTIQGGASQPINGLATAITIPSNSTVTLRDVPNPKTVSGCHWVM